ncbi:MAG: aldo/keto reductase [Provencibacterium sp.]|jgi:diketogulonate reductase-like aldo/keto reductase|nr:aldo/keto reductase [Provencibacterium sp.]
MREPPSANIPAMPCTGSGTGRRQYEPACRFPQRAGKALQRKKKVNEKAMEKPFVVCHMFVSMDGKIDGAFMSHPAAAAARDEYGKLRGFYYYQRRIDPQVPPEQVADTMAALITEGKIRAWGISETDESYLRRAHAVCPVAAVQNRYSMMARWHEKLFPVLEELGIAYVAFSPMANGFLSGKYDAGSNFEPEADFRSRMPQYTPEGFARAKELLAMLHELAAAKNATPAQISLSWMLCKKPYIIPIPGSRKPGRLQKNFEAAHTLLTPEETAEIDHKLDAMQLLVFGGH